jgi:hypothetical protein
MESIRSAAMTLVNMADKEGIHDGMIDHKEYMALLQSENYQKFTTHVYKLAMKLHDAPSDDVTKEEL